jgi:hypothetical protein
MKTTTTLILSIFSFVCVFGQTLPPKQPYNLDVNQIHSGHSLTDPLFGQPWPGQYVNLITQLRGVWALNEIGKSTIPGSPMFWRWANEGTHPSTQPPFSARHNIDQWELLVITEGIPIPNNGANPPLITPANEHLSLYVNNAWNNGNNGNGAATLLWTTWTNLDGTEGPWRQTLDIYEALWEEMQDYANANRPVGAPAVYLIPGHRMMARIYDDIQLGLVPGITNINQFFSDNIHTNSLGDYAIAMIHYACIFNENPVGLTNDLMPNPPSGFQIPSPSLALYLQTIIWEVITNYPRTGIIDNALNIDESNFENKLSIYPNPSSEYIYVRKGDNVINFEKVIINSLGKEVYRGNENIINISHLPNGIYILRAENQNVKIIKN